MRAERNVAHRLIEECMLAANEAVARELLRRKLPAFHRVHEPPDPENVRELARFLEGFGLRLRLEHGRATPAAFQAVLDAVEGRPGGAARAHRAPALDASRRATRPSRSAISGSP